MSGKRGGGALFDSVSFQKRGSVSDGHGGMEAIFTEQFSCRAAIMFQRGGEAIMAGRLEGRNTVIIRIRSSAAALLATADWRIVDKRSGAVYAVAGVTPTTDRAYLDFLAESGVAA